MRSRDRSQHVADLLQRPRLAVAIETEAQLDHFALLAVELAERAADARVQPAMDQLVFGRRDARLLEHLAELRPSLAVAATWSLSDTSRSPMRMSASTSPSEISRSSAISRCVGVRFSCSVSSATSRPNRAATADSFCGNVNARVWPDERVRHRLAHPPDRVGDELDVARGIEPARRLHQPEVALVNEIEERHAEAAIALGVADDEAEVAFDEPRSAASSLSSLDAAAELALLVGRQTRQPRDRAQVRLQRVASFVIGIAHAG